MLPKGKEDMSNRTLILLIIGLLHPLGARGETTAYQPTPAPSASIKKSTEHKAIKLLHDYKVETAIIAILAGTGLCTVLVHEWRQREVLVSPPLSLTNSSSFKQVYDTIRKKRKSICTPS
jgi:hypothetical protein